ncbi:MAG: hypothetical protein J6A59_09305 [Lachnospiraceae bacterium]|nr:hypothetical protein [Lachnospiraceae bacterium]
MKTKFNILNIYKPTKEDIKRNKVEHSEYDRLGINMSIFYNKNLKSDQDDEYTKNELKAISYITMGKRVPKRLEEYLLATKEERLARYPKITDDDTFESRIIIDDINLDD